MSRIVEAVGAAELLTRIKVRWYPFTLRRVARSCGERLIEWADRADERASHASPMVVLRVAKQWEPKRGAVKRFTR